MMPAPTDPTSNGRCIGYLRVSTAEQVTSGLGLEAQRHAIAHAARRLNLTVAATFADEGQSGAAPITERTGLLDAIAALRPHDTLIVAKLDRLSRGDVLENAAIEELVRRKRARILSAADEGTARTDDPTATLMRGIVQLFAGHERALISARTRAALAAKKAKGERIGADAYGTTDTEKAIVDVVQDCRAAGFSYQATAAELNHRGFTTRRQTPWRAQYVRSLMQTITGTRMTQPTDNRAARATRAAINALTTR